MTAICKKFPHGLTFS